MASSDVLNALDAAADFSRTGMLCRFRNKSHLYFTFSAGFRGFLTYLHNFRKEPYFPARQMRRPTQGVPVFWGARTAGAPLGGSFGVLLPCLQQEGVRLHREPRAAGLCGARVLPPSGEIRSIGLLSFTVQCPCDASH